MSRMSKNSGYKSAQLIEDEFYELIQKGVNPNKNNKFAALSLVDRFYYAYSVHNAEGKVGMVQSDSGNLLISLLYFSRLHGWQIDTLIEKYAGLFSPSEKIKPKPVYYWLHEIHVAFDNSHNIVENTTENTQRMQVAIFGVWHSMAFVLNDRFGLYVLKVINDTWSKICGLNAKSVDSL